MLPGAFSVLLMAENDSITYRLRAFLLTATNAASIMLDRKSTSPVCSALTGLQVPPPPFATF